jgi:hypothetical protein
MGCADGELNGRHARHPDRQGHHRQVRIFQRMRLKMSLLHLPAICYLTVSERPQVFAESGLAPFDKCTVYIGDTLAATMYAVAVEPHIDKAGHQVSLALAGADDRCSGMQH